MAESGAVVVLITYPLDGDVNEFVTALVTERWAACVSVLPASESVFRWQGRIEWARERQILVKTLESRVERLVRRVRELHPYDTPEVVALPIVGGSESYLAWIRDEVAE